MTFSFFFIHQEFSFECITNIYYNIFSDIVLWSTFVAYVLFSTDYTYWWHPIIKSLCIRHQAIWNSLGRKHSVPVEVWSHCEVIKSIIVKPSQRKQRNTNMNQNQPSKVTLIIPQRANDTEKKAEIPKTWKIAVDKRRKRHFYICEVWGRKREGRNDPPLQLYAVDCHVPAVST